MCTSAGDPAGTRSNRPQFNALWITVLSFILSGAGCAKIGDPQPPEVRIPEAAVDLAARQLSDFIVLTVSKPERNTNGSEATTLKSLDVFRLSEDPAGNDPTLSYEQFMKGALRILSIPSARFSEYLEGKTFVIQDRLFPEKSSAYAHTFRYAVLFINNKRQSAGLSNQVLITPVPIPLAPAGLSAVQTQDSIGLRWTAPSENMDGSTPPRIAGYNVYRAEEPGRFPSTLINTAPVTTPDFEDRNFRFDTTYYYSITTVGSLKSPFAESLPSEALTLASRDVFPPAPPEDFSAILQGDTATLLWAPSRSADVAGYRIWRQQKGTAGNQLIHDGLIGTLSFRQRVESGKNYLYEIRAVDTHGNESPAVRTEIEKL